MIYGETNRITRTRSGMVIMMEAMFDTTGFLSKKKAKTARLDELNILLNMDKKENEIVGGEPDEGEAVGGRKEKSYER